jgi:hypothetical protein
MATGIDTPYRDPRTAYGRRIPVGDATELSGMPPEFQQPRRAGAAPAAAPAAAPPAGGIDAPQRAGTLARGGLRRLAGPVGAAVAVAPEAMDVARVARAPGSTGIDVATQAYEGIGRLASAGAGAALGAKLGAPAGPWGAGIGGIAGGAYGYWAADKAIRGGRELAGVDPRSPVEQIAQAPTGGAMPLPPGVTPSTAGAGRGSVNPPRANPNASPPTTEARDARSLRTDGSNTTIGIVPGYGAEAQARDARARAIDAQNVALRDQLAGSWNPNPGAGPASGAINENWRKEIELKNMETSANSITLSPREKMLRLEQIQRLRERLYPDETPVAVAEVNARTQRGIADLNSRTQREVASIAADSRTTAAETNANARAAAAEAAARRYLPVAGGQQVVEIGGLPTTVTLPSRVFDIQGGRYVDPPAPQGGGKPAQTQAPKAGEVRQGYRYMGGDPASPESWKKVA